MKMLISLCKMCDCILCVAGTHLVSDMQAWRTLKNFGYEMQISKNTKLDAKINFQQEILNMAKKWESKHPIFSFQTMCETEQNESKFACAACKNRNRKCKTSMKLRSLYIH